jgi:DNA-binding LacI/PurR family transcriptional regulator
MVLYNVNKREQRDHYFQKMSMRRRVDGLIIISLPPNDGEAADFKLTNTQTILLDCYNPLLTSIVVDNIGGAYEMVSYLLSIGRRRIGFINGSVEGNFRFNQANDRYTGYCAALQQYQLEPNPNLITTSSWNRQAGYEAALHLLKLPESQRPDAIFAASDIQALGVLAAAKTQNLNVPQDISVAGYDGIEMSEILDLTTIQQPIAEMGRLAVQLLLKKIKGETQETQETIELKPKLVVRLTTET